VAASFGFIFFVPVLIAALLMVGYLCKYMERIVCNSALGKSEAPDWPDFNGSAVLMPIKIGLLYLATQIPAVVLAVLASLGMVSAGLDPAIGAVVGWVLCELGFLFFPMMLMAFFIRKSFFSALNPVVILGGIKAAGAQYWMAVAIWLVILPVRALLVGALGAVPFLGIMLSTPISLYFFMVGCRALGVVYQARERELGWY
jgi:hypothetical protein